MKPISQPAIGLSFLIDYTDWENKENLTVPLELTSFKRTNKRSRLDSIPKHVQPETKRHRPAALTSTFLPPPTIAPVSRPSTLVTFQNAILSTSNGATQITLKWSDKADSVTSRIFDNALSFGKNKTLFEVEIDDVVFVAKRCRDPALDASSLFANQEFLLEDFGRLMRLSSGLRAFYKSAEDLGAMDDVDTKLAVGVAPIVREVVSAAQPPSVASGVTAACFDKINTETLSEDRQGQDPSICWLLQARISVQATDNWNLRRSPITNASSKLGSTINAFAHHFYQHCDGRLSIAHLQSEFSRILFFVFLPWLPSFCGHIADGTKYGKVIYDAVLEEEGPPLHICNRICGFLNLPEAEDGDDAENV
ncbi:hypothetical protein C8J57DRAFT_1255058 [Mycena rebaudengoi]|nr:hypothetical protein C8J57DRAFT_1255058 [Mycena rebaudengoi]